MAAWGSVVVNWYVIHFFDYSGVHVSISRPLHFSITKALTGQRLLRYSSDGLAPLNMDLSTELYA
jgi:hypothetical protein